MPGMARRATSRAGCEMSTIKSSRCLPSTAHILDALFDGSRNRTSLCARAMVVLTTRMVREPPDLRSEDCSSTATRSRAANFSSRLARCQLPVSQLRIRREERRHAPDPESRRVVRSAPTTWDADSLNRRAPGSARDRQLVLCFRPRCAHLLHASDCYRHTPVADLRAFGGGGAGSLAGLGL